MTIPYGARPRLAKLVLAKLMVGLLLLVPASAASARTVRILVLGDSLAAGYGLSAPEGFQAQMSAALRARGHDVQLIDGAVSGDTTAGGRARLEWALADGADAALIELGGNDGLRALPPESTRANLKTILDALAQKRIPVLLSGMVAPPNLGPEYGDAFGAVFSELGRRDGVIYDPFFLEGVAGDAALNQPDHIHPNPEGVRRVVARLLPAMEQLIAKVP